MAISTLRELLAGDGFVLSSWSGLRDPAVHEALIRSPFDAITFDVQHGVQDVASIEAGIGRAAMLGKPAIVRLALEDRANAARSLDFGASAVVMPMIGSVEEARAFADAVKYQPLGSRSFGPTRAVEVHGLASGRDYMASANRQTLALGMIETRGALAALDEILAVEGIDGVFVGPSDLSIALSGNGQLDPYSEANAAAIRRIAEAARRVGKLAAIYALNAEDARRYREEGYRLVCVSSDVGLLKSAAASLVQTVRA
jgi:4-hydroxy-2-oxoheptanedioate aldolase